MAKYYRATVTHPMENYVDGTNKAWRFTLDGTYGKSLYVPKSLIKHGDINEAGNEEIFLPLWFVAKGKLWKSVERIIEVNFDSIVER